MKRELYAFPLESEKEYRFHLESVCSEHCRPNYRIDRKNSDIYAFEYTVSGKGTYICNAQTYNMKRGSLSILHKGTDHIYFSHDEEPWVKIWFIVEGTLVDSFFDLYNLGNVFHIHNTDFEILFESIFLTAKYGRENNIEAIDHKVSLIFHEIVMNIALQNERKEKIYSSYVSEVKKYLDGHIEENVSMKELSKKIYKSPSQIIRQFKKEIGCTPYQYLLNKKIDVAKIMLKNTDTSIKEIAFMLKFKDEHYFSNLFKSKTKMSPTHYRTQYRK